MYVKCPKCKGRGKFHKKTGATIPRRQNEVRAGSKPKPIPIKYWEKCSLCNGARKIDWVTRILRKEDDIGG